MPDAHPPEICQRCSFRDFGCAVRRLLKPRATRCLFFSRRKQRIWRRYTVSWRLDEIISAAQREWRRLDRPVEPRLVELVKFPVQCSHLLPRDCSPDEARTIARALAIKNGRVFRLTLSPVRCEYFLPSGDVRKSVSVEHYVKGLEEKVDLQRRDRKTNLERSQRQRYNSSE